MSTTALHQPPTTHVAAASLNQTVGDWQGNSRRIREVMAEARARGARLLVLPEIGIPGYSLGDRLPRRGTLERSWKSLVDLAESSEGLVTCLGLPVSHRGVLFNTMAIVANGEVHGLVAKEHLATGDVEYESRWYTSWPHGRVEEFTAPDGRRIPIGSLLFSAGGIGRFALEICEDGWKGIRPGSRYALAGAEILCNPSASWFTLGKHQQRRRLVEQASLEDHSVYLYSSLLGCDATRLVFDGSLLVAADGRLVCEGRRFLFAEEWDLVDAVVDLDALRQTRREEGSWSQQVLQAADGDFGATCETLDIPGDFTVSEAAPISAPYWEAAPAPPVDASLIWMTEAGLIPTLTHEDLPHLELELAISLALRDYVAKSGISHLAVALSGGRDSAMVSLLVHRMFRYNHPDLSDEALAEMVRDHFLTAYLSTDHSSEATRSAAEALAGEIGARFYDLDIQGAVDLHLGLVEGAIDRKLDWADPTDDLALQNVQARLRGSMIWMLANLNGALLLATSNKSEAAVGYTTMDGDTSGGVAPIADVPKSLVKLWVSWAARFHGYASVARIEAMEPTAELRPPEQGQTDEGDLMPFAILDQLLYQFVEKGQDPLEIFLALWPSLASHYEQDPRGLATDIRRFVSLLCRAQWKRERFAISFRVSAFDLDPKTGFRFPAVQAPFREELDDLDGYVAELIAKTTEAP